MNNNNVTLVKAGVFQQISRVMVLELRGNPIVNVQLEAFAFLPRLKKLCVNFHFFFFFFKTYTRRKKTLNNDFLYYFDNRILSEVKELRHFPLLNGTGALELIRIDRAKIKLIPSYTCQHSPHLRSL
jgi:hypothetical protein